MYKTYPFTLEKLPYDFDALEPVIDAKTMEIHHDRHQQTYLDNLNKVLADKSDLHDKTLEELMLSDIDTVRNNAGGVWNHDFFWKAMIGVNVSHIGDDLAAELRKSFGTVEEFMIKFEALALGRFGSGYAWLVKDGEGKLEVLSTPNQDSPLREGKSPLLGIDVWEHAYYLKYLNKRVDYVKAWWSVVNWGRVEELWKA